MANSPLLPSSSSQTPSLEQGSLTTAAPPHSTAALKMGSPGLPLYLFYLVSSMSVLKALECARLFFLKLFIHVWMFFNVNWPGSLLLMFLYMISSNCVLT